MENAGEIVLAHVRATFALIELIKKDVEPRFAAQGMYLIPEGILKNLFKSLTWLQLHSHHVMSTEDQRELIKLLNDLRNQHIGERDLRIRLEEIMADVEKRL